MSLNVIVCGIPRRLDGEYYCPYCNFTSYDIEDFAVAMCWDCAFNDDEDPQIEEDEKEEENLLTDEAVRENRLAAVSALVNNPAGYKQITQMHRNANLGRCATGLMAETFHIPMPQFNSSTVNRQLDEMLGDSGMASTIISKNDHDRWTFTAIGTYLANRWGINISDVKEENN